MDITALGIALDPELETLSTPTRQVCILQLVGLTSGEFDTMSASKSDATELLWRMGAGSPLLMTDLERKL